MPVYVCYQLAMSRLRDLGAAALVVVASAVVVSGPADLGGAVAAYWADVDR